MPKTRFGNYALRSMAAFVFFFLTAQFVIMTGQRGGDTFTDNLWISVPMFFAFASALLAGIFGAIGIFREGERSPIIFLIAAIALLILIFLLGEFLFPH